MGYRLFLFLPSCLCVLLCNNLLAVAAQSSPNAIYKERLDNSIDAVQSGAIKSNVVLQTIDNHKPMFKDCESYKPEVEENRDAGTHVITVKAVDEDPPTEKGGRIHYKIVEAPGQRIDFKINNVTGEVFTNIPFDRDEPYRQKELYVTVQVKDDGRPALADICTFKVTILDINDNQPIFDQTRYDAKVSEDKERGEVMRVYAYDFDELENAKLTYSLANDSSASSTFNEYFRIDSNTGVVFLKQPLHKKQSTQFSTTVYVHDNGVPQNRASVDITITVVGSGRKAPTIVSYNDTVNLKEDFSDFEKPVAVIVADSNIDDPNVAFELVKGKTVQTNKDQTFVLDQSENSTKAVIMLKRRLDYETVPEFQLTVKVENKDKLSTSAIIVVKVEDVNDEVPFFIEMLNGSLIENDNVGAQAMQVRAIDKDGTSPNNVVFYELVSHTDLFNINRETGVITAATTFDREKERFYYVMVKAYDGAPSALLRDKSQPNSVNQKFTIDIEDRNDNTPMFDQKIYVVHNISETSNILKDVIEVRAKDEDSAALIIYSIIEGNVNNAFTIEESTGRIKVNNKLDYETIQSYNLTVRAFDGIFDDTTKVIIHILNENDEPPKFVPYNKIINITEETVSEGCIINLQAYDPDKKPEEDQEIVYQVAKEYRSFLDVTSNGCVSLIRKLDRDPPNGSSQYQAYIYAYDNNNGPKSLPKGAEINIVLMDINDNAPILNMTEVVWYENEQPGKIVTLEAIDYDTIENGPPFTYEIADTDPDILDKFSVIGNDLHATAYFDRELKKFYDVPIRISDSGTPRQSAISTLRVIIGDRNDNEAQDGSSEIFVYKYEKFQDEIPIGRVYVNDPDDWDLPDKVFQPDGELDENFALSYADKGMIIMRISAQPGVYRLNFLVTEEHLPKIASHTVRADVTVTVKGITEEAVIKSGSIRLRGSSAEQFIEKDNQMALSRKDVLQTSIAKILNVSRDNVDVFTVMTSPGNSSLIDVRFSAHGSPYYAPEKLNNKATDQQEILERELGVEFVMVSINECVLNGNCPPNSSCSNVLSVKTDSAVVFTNKTSFVGVKAVTEAVCRCVVREVHECFNGGSPTDGGCSCSEGYEGPHCELMRIGFDGDGWAMYPTFDACNNTEISLSIVPETKDGLIFYVGPLTMRHAALSRDFMSLELRDGRVILKLDLGQGPREIISRDRAVNDGAMHKIKISFTTEDVQLQVDECLSNCTMWTSLEGGGGLLNVNGPLQIGGRRNIFTSEQSRSVWDRYAPTNKGFSGCIANFTYNSYIYNLGAPSDSYKPHANCNYQGMTAATFGIDSNFLVAILVCIAILLILLLAVVVHKRKQDSLNEKDMDDTRENIINYEDEGGGECDTNFDLSVLRPSLDEKPPIRDNLYKQGGEVPADISGFLDNKKRACDKDPDNLPYDDVRHYGYEGDGNTSGSLSSLASCTDDGDINFNHLSSFGPRFRKLADMYGDDASEEGSQNGGEESWC